MQLRETIVKKPSDIFDRSLEGVPSWLRSIWNRAVESPSLAVVLESTYDAQKRIDLLRNPVDQPDGSTPTPKMLPLPWVSVIPVTLEAATSRPSAFLTKKFGVNAGFINGRAQEIREHVTPVNVGMGVRFVTRDINEATMFARLLMQYWPMVGLQLTNSQTGTEVVVKLKIDPQISIPAAASGTPGDLIEVETTLILETWTGDTVMNTTIKMINIESIVGLGSNDAPAETESHHYLDLYDETKRG